MHGAIVAVNDAAISIQKHSGSKYRQSKMAINDAARKWPEILVAVS